MIYGYIRVSSDKQTVENQKFEIEQFATRENMNIDDWISETISGTKNYDKRKLGRLLRKVPPQKARDALFRTVDPHTPEL